MSQDILSSNKRIVKNTIVLYVRMLVVMVISFYTSRVVLDSLGENDYGVYSVVGGVVVMFTVISSTFSSVISRFLTYVLGKGDKEYLNKVFSTSVTIQIGVALIVGFIIEIVGVWFLKTQMNIPDGRMEAANWVLQCSVISFMIGLVCMPYNALIISHERMTALAYISIVEVLGKLGIVYLLRLSTFDMLKTYATLLMLMSVIVAVVYALYSHNNFEETHYTRNFDKNLLKEISKFTGWNLFGNSAYMLNTQGVNMLINIFFGVTYNAARGIAVQVDGAVNQFVNNFTMAMSPQITKSYAAGDLDHVYLLICNGSKYAYFIMFIFVVPVVLEADNLLSIWLVEVPEETSVFLRLVVLSSLTNVMSNPMLTAIMATGNIKRYEIEVTLVGCLVFPFTWVAYKLGAPAYVTYLIFMAIYLLLNFVRLVSLKRLMGFPLLDFVCNVLPKIGAVTVCAFVIPLLVIYLIPMSLGRLVVTSILSI